MLLRQFTTPYDNSLKQQESKNTHNMCKEGWTSHPAAGHCMSSIKSGRRRQRSSPELLCPLFAEQCQNKDKGSPKDWHLSFPLCSWWHPQETSQPCWELQHMCLGDKDVPSYAQQPASPYSQLNLVLKCCQSCNILQDLQGGWKYMIFKVLSNPSHSMILGDEQNAPTPY